MLYLTTVLSLFFVHCKSQISDEHTENHYYDTPANNQKELVDFLRMKKNITSERVANVMLAVDRQYFYPDVPYEDYAQVFKRLRRIDSPPNTIAFALETLKDHLTEGKKALDIGTCTGYVTMCMALMVGKTGSVLGVEKDVNMILFAKKNLSKVKSLVKMGGKIRLRVGRVAEIAPDYGPFDAINVAIPTPRVPQVLTDVLNVGGRMLIAIGEVDLQFFEEIFIYDKDENGNITITRRPGEYFMHFFM